MRIDSAVTVGIVTVNNAAATLEVAAELTLQTSLDVQAGTLALNYANILGAGSITNAGTIVALASENYIQIAGAVTNGGTVTVASGMGLQVSNTFANVGTVACTGGNFTANGWYNGGATSTVTISNGGKVELGGTVGGVTNFTFGAGTGNVLTLESPPAAPVLISSMDAGDRINLPGLDPTAITQPTFVGGVLTFTQGTSTYSFLLPGVAAGTRFAAVAGSGQAIDLVTALPGAPVVTGLTAATDTGASASDGLTNNANPAITGTAEAGSTVTVYANGVPLGTTTASGTGAWTFIPTTALANGAYAITATASDGLGGISAPSASATITIDTVAPAVTSSLTDANGQSVAGRVTAAAAAGLRGTADPNAVVTIAQNGTTLGTVTADGTGAWAFAGLTGASGALTASTTDAAGNTGTAEVNFTLLGLDAPVDGVVTPNWTSSDLGFVLRSGATVQYQAGTQLIQLADGELSFGTATNEAFVERLYQGLLGRGSDKGGLAGWDTALDNGASRSSVAQGFLDSAEYQARSGGLSDTDFVTSLYQNVLGREPDSDGATYWLGQLGAGATRADVAASIADSPEAQQHWASVTSQGLFAYDPLAATVRQVYATALGREAEAAGLDYWADALRSGMTLADLGIGISGSAEFEALHGAQSTADFVQSLYQSGLGRAVEAEGATYWGGMLDSGAMSRGDVMMAIATSAEAQQHQSWAL